MMKRFYMTLMLAASTGCWPAAPAPPIPVAPTPVKRGDYPVRGISRTTGTSVRDLARLDNISPPYTIEGWGKAEA